MSWNWSYSKRKQKEMAKKSASYQQGLEGVKPLYRELGCSKPQQNTDSWKREQERQRRVNIISVVMITLVCIIGISVISYFATFGV